jgi:hypothetical protein
VRSVNHKPLVTQLDGLMNDGQVIDRLVVLISCRNAIFRAILAFLWETDLTAEIALQGLPDWLLVVTRCHADMVAVP